jgi:hypothetical protein
LPAAAYNTNTLRQTNVLSAKGALAPGTIGHANIKVPFRLKRRISQAARCRSRDFSDFRRKNKKTCVHNISDLLNKYFFYFCP